MYNLSNYDAQLLTEEKALADYFLQLTKHTKNYKAAANWLNNEIKSYLNENHLSIEHLSVTPQQIADIIQIVDDNIISSSAAKSIFKAYIEGDTRSAIAIAEALNLVQSNNKDELSQWIEKALQKYPDKVEEYKKGKKGNINLFMGEVMKLSRGIADPKATVQLLEEYLK